MLGADGSKLARSNLCQTSEESWHQRLEVCEAIRSSAQKYDSNWESFKSLLIGQICVDRNECFETLARSAQQLPVLHPSPTLIDDRHDVVVGQEPG